MTARALELIASADVDRPRPADPAGAPRGARPDAELIYVGKRTRRRAIEQEEIERLMVEPARAGRSVVRLKGGDPFVFGRGGEEAEALRAAGVPFEVVPGVTAGDRRTRLRRDPGHPPRGRLGRRLRDRARGSRQGGVGDRLGPRSPRFPGTLVLYMGVKRLAEIAAALIAAGRDPDEPAAAIERGTLPGQRTSRPATLAELAVRRAGSGPRR